MLTFLIATWLAGASGQFADTKPGRYAVVPQEILHAAGGMPLDTVDNTCPPCCSFGKKFEAACMDQGSFDNDPLDCPSLDKNVRNTPSGPKYTFYCGMQTHRENIKVQTSKDLVECVDLCGALSGCMGVDYDRSGKRCWLKSEMVSKDDPLQPNKVVDTASMVALQLLPNEVCPDLNGQIRFASEIPFKIFCGLQLLGENLPGSPVKVANLAECAKLCADNPKCQGADHNPVTKACSLKANYLSAPSAQKQFGQCLVPLAKRVASVVMDL